MLSLFGTLLQSAQDLQRYEEWMWHAKEFHAKCDAVQAMFNSLTDIPNRPLLYDMYSYVWDVKEIVFMLDAYLSWLGKIIVDSLFQLLQVP